ncbi:Interferon-induced GTP-binding protein Mx2 [Coniochaeta hoffmannii]|uniref:Interferon-induced GTP-binding protein Mx2 n=1 Tax=Coniochaeta hoffmannii TaxID=91930 RepID=A0AA38RW42_9PEZI|nr:Interferon-induced GTP-binding protein Mx2 [Coniochaeta hoffmannii]
MTSELLGSPQLATQTSDGVAYLDDERFSQAYTIPLDATPGRSSPLTVSYSDYGYHHPDGPSHDNVVLICGPMLSCRFFHVAKDNLAKRYGLRIIYPDRPGMGRTTAVPLDQRVEAWLQIIPALLAHLGISHISLVSQSGGTIYAASTLLHQRHLLHPTRPYVAMCAPWIAPKDTGAPLMVLTSGVVPSALLGKVQTVNRFVVSMAPVSSFSSMCLKAVVPGKRAEPPLAEGVDPAEAEFETKVLSRVIYRAYEEDMTGLGQEALFLMQRGVEWGDWGNYDRLVEMVAARERAESTKVKVRAYFAESDIMIGTDKGPAYFDKCWREKGAGQVDYHSRRVPFAEHDYILSLRYGVAEEIFKEISVLSEQAGS